MKKRIWVLMLILAVILSIYFYSFARQKFSLPRPEDMKGREASTLGELETEIEQTKTATKGSTELKLTGPVWVEK